MRWAWSLAAATIACVPLRADAQPVFEESFETWTDDCLRAGLCESTRIIDPAARGVRLSNGCAVPGQCLEMRHDVVSAPDPILLDPFAADWAPSGNAISTSFLVRLDDRYFAGDDSFALGFVELVRAFCEPAPCNVLLEVHRNPVDVKPVLVWQREANEDSVIRILCELPIDAAVGWHRVYGRATWDAATGLGECELHWDDEQMSETGVSYLGADGELPTLSNVEIWGSSFTTTGEQARPGLDEICIGATNVVCDPAPVPVPPPPGDGPSTVTFRGGGGCDCSAGTRPRSPSFATLAALGLAALLAVRARRRKPLLPLAVVDRRQGVVPESRTRSQSR